MIKKHELRIKRHNRIRSAVSGTPERPRLSVYRGLRHITAQIIDDTTGKTLLGLSDKGIAKGTGLERAAQLGAEIAKRAKEKNITAVVFDRGGFQYHGQVKALAEAMRESGMTI